MKKLWQVCKISKQKKYNVIIFDIKCTLAGNKQNIITMAISSPVKSIVGQMIIKEVFQNTHVHSI